MADPLHILDVTFTFLIRATAQVSMIVVVIVAARLALRRWLSTEARYALWLLLVLPFVAPLFPAVPFVLPEIVWTAASEPLPPATLQAGASAPPRWRVEYGPLDGAVPGPPATTTKHVIWLRLTAFAWITGVIVLSLRVGVAHAVAIRQASRSPAENDPVTLSLLHECRDLVRTRRAPRLLIAPPGVGPALLGVLRPRLLLPDGSAASLSRAELRFIFLHELVHLKRWDVLAELLLTLLQIIQWLNPLMWMAAGRCRADREIACDAAVLALTGDRGRADYGRTILRLATELAGRPRSRIAGAAVGILETRSPLERRLRMIAVHPGRRFSRWPAALVALVALALVACSNVQAPRENERPTASTGRSSADNPTAGAASESTVGSDGHVVSRDRVTGSPPPAPEDAALRQKLDSHLPELNFAEVPLTDAVDFLRDATGANIFVNWKALESAGIERDTPITARLREVKLSKALNIILNSAAGDGPRLSSKIDDGVITVSTLDELAKEDTVTVVYDVRDLITSIPDFEPEPARNLWLQGDGAAAPAPKPPSPADTAKATADAAEKQSLDRVIRLLRETVEPDTWGRSAQLRELQGQLIVTGPPRVHEGIVPLLRQLRETRGIQVSLEARFISLDDAVLDALPLDLRERLAGQLRAAKDPVVLDRPAGPVPAGAEAPGQDPSKVVALDAAQVDQVLRAVQGSKSLSILSAPRITLFNGQSAYVAITTSTAYVADYSMIKREDGSTKYEPQMRVAEAGLVLWGRATASADRKYVTLTLRPRLTQLAEGDDVPWDRSPPGEKLTVRRPKVLASDLATTVSVPDGKTLLLGGLKGYIGPDGRLGEGPIPKGKVADGKSTPVILLVKPTLIIKPSEEEDAFPLLNNSGTAEPAR